jgi:hypothetical protein
MVNRMITSAAETGQMNKLMEVIQTYSADMNGINQVTAFHRIARLASSSTDNGGCAGSNLERAKRHPVFQQLYSSIHAGVLGHSLRRASAEIVESSGHQEMPVQCVSVVAWSCATMQIHSSQLFAAICEIASPRLHTFQSFELSNLLWAFAKLAMPAIEVFRSAARCILQRKRNEFKVHCLTMIAWSFATARRRHPKVFSSLGEDITLHAGQLKPQEISNTLWAFAKCRFADQRLFAALGQVAIAHAKAGSFKPQELSNTVWAFATAGVLNPLLFAVVEAEAVRQRHNLTPQNIANILWAYAKLEVHDCVRLFPALLDVAVGKLERFKPQELSAMLWSAARMNPDHDEFFKAASWGCSQNLRELSVGSLKNLAEAFSIVETGVPGLFDAVTLESLRRLPQCDAAFLVSLLKITLQASSNPALGAPAKRAAADVSRRLSKYLAQRLSETHPGESLNLQGLLGVYHANAEATITTELESALIAFSADSTNGLGADGLAENGDDEDEEDEAQVQQPGDSKAFSWETFGSCSTSAEGDSPGEGASDEERPCEGNGHAGTCIEGKNRQCTAPGGLAPAAYVQRVASKLRLGKDDLQTTPPANMQPWKVPLPACASLTPAGALAHPSLALAHGEPATVRIAAATAVLPPSISEGFAHAFGATDPAHSPATDRTSPPVTEALERRTQRPLQELSVSCLVMALPGGSYEQFDCRTLASSELVGVGSETIYLRHGLMNMRVVVKRVPSLSPASAIADHPNVLQPVATISDTSLQEPSGGHRQSPQPSRGHFLMYPHCESGGLFEWVAERRAAGQPLKPDELSSIVQAVLLGAEALLPHEGAHAVSAVRGDEIFMGEAAVVCLRRPLRTRLSRSSNSMKWMSPDEAGRSGLASDLWPALSFRLGMLIYCLGAGLGADPYPNRSADAVLNDLVREAEGLGKPVRPDLDAFQGPDLLRHLLVACFRLGGQGPPTRGMFSAVLASVCGGTGKYLVP